MEDSFIVIWLSLGLAMMVCSIIVGAWTKEQDMGEVIFSTVLVAVMWPLLLPIAAFLAPFVMLYYFVSWLRDKTQR